MSTTPLTIDPSTFTPLPGGSAPSSEGSALQGAVSYGAQQDPVRYAKRLDLQEKLGIAPEISQGNEEEVQQTADINSIDYPRFAAANPRTTKWASNPHNAAVSGVDEIHRLGGIEQNAVNMRAYTPTFGERIADKALDLGQWMMGGTISRGQLRQNFWTNPVIRPALNIASGAVDTAGNVGSFFGWHGDGPSKENLLQRVAASLDPSTATVGGNKPTELDWLAKNVAPMVPALLASGGASLLARSLGISTTAAKVLTGLSIGGMFDADQAGQTYTAVAGAGGSDDDARSAANRVALINALPNAAFGATDVVPLLRDNPLLTSLGLGGATGATGQIGQNVVTGQPLGKGLPSAMLQGAAVQGGLHLGMSAFGGHMADAVTAAEESKLRERSPEKFNEAMQTIFAGDASLRIPADRFQEYLRAKQQDPAVVASSIGATNYAEAVLSGGDVEVPPANFLSKLEPEQQKELLPHVVDPQTGLTSTQHAEGTEELKQWMASGGPAQLQSELDAADAESAATPEWQAVKEDLRQGYVNAGETPEVSEDLATKHANVYSNLARQAGLKPTELLALYNPKVVTGEAPHASEPLYQDATGADNAGTLYQESIDRAGRQYDSPEMAEARSKAEAAEAAGDHEAVAEWTERFHELREADPRFQKVLAAREAYVQAKSAAAAKLGDEDLARAVNETFRAWKTEAAKVRRYGQLPGEAEPRGWKRTLADGSVEIGKTNSGDPSTWIHERGHTYLDLMRYTSHLEGASDALKGDWQKVLDFLGAKDGEPLAREQEEKWAKAVEQYVHKGEAPSPSLREIFQRLSVWLRSIYKKESDLGEPLPREIREVMDRLHASEEGVNRATEHAGPQLFTSPEEAGWTEEEFRHYAAENSVSVEAAKAHILGKLKETAERDQSQSWRDEVYNVRRAMGEQIDARPEYKAIRSLRKGRLENGTPLTLNKDLLVEQFSAERVRKLQELHPGLYRADGGADAEVAAEMHGFASAEEMVRTLENTPRRNAAVDEATRDYMTAKYGDIRFDGTLDHKALLALESRRGNSLYRELKALRAKLAKLDAKRTAMRDMSVAPIEAYRDMAHQAIEKKPIADLQPRRWLDASRKYSREAFDAARRGDAQAAADAKHKELLNHFLFLEATEAKEYVDKFEANVKRWQGRNTQANLGLAGSDYRAQFNRLLFRYGLTGMPAEMPERPLTAWADEMYDSGRDPVLPPSIQDESRGINYRRASLSEVRDLHDALKNIKSLAKQELEIVVNGHKVALAEAKADMMARARESVKVSPEPIFDEDRSLGAKARDKMQRFFAPMIRTEFLMKRLDGGVEGPWHDNIWNLAADAQGVERELQEGVTKHIGDVLRDMPDKQRMKMLDKVVLPGFGEITRKRLISMALNLGNEGNLDRLRNTFLSAGRDPDAVERIPKLLTREDWTLVQTLWDALKPMGERMNQLERRLTGLPPVMVKPTPLHIEFPDGSAMDLAGGYYPIVMDPKHSERAQQQDVNSTARNLMETGYGRASTSRGYTKARTGYGGQLLLDHEQVLSQHIAKASKDISHREFILAANRLLLDPAVQKTLRETVGPGFEKQMMPWLRTIVNDRNGSAVQGLDDYSNWMGRLRTNVVEASLSFKLSTLLLQVTHASSIFLHTTPASFSQALVDFLAKPSEMTEKIRSLSPNEMKNRGENIDRDMRSVLQEGIEGRTIGKVIAKAGMFPVKMVDHLLSFPLWWAAYQDALTEHVNLPEDRAQYLAMHKADGAVRMGLGANAPKDLPGVMRRNDFWRLVTTLGGFENLKLNQIADATTQVGRDGRSGGLAAAGGKFTYRMMMAAIIPAVIGAYVTGNKPKDDESVGEWAAKRALLFPPETLPLVGNVFRAIDEGRDARFSPIVNVVDKAVTAGQQAASDKEDKDWTGIGLNAGEAAGLASGVPGTTQSARTLRYVHRAQQGAIIDPNAWDAIVGAPHK